MVRKVSAKKSAQRPLPKTQPERARQECPIPRIRQAPVFSFLSMTDEDCKLDECIFQDSKEPFQTVELGEFNAVKGLFKKDDVHDLMDSSCQNLMFPAVRRSSQALATCKFLQTKGVECNFRDFRQQTPLFHAVANFLTHQSIDMLDFLLAHDCHLSDRDIMQSSPLMLAVQHNHSSVVDAFLGRGADVNIADQDGNTLIHAAAAAGNVLILAQLCEITREIKSVNKKGQTPIDVSLNSECRETILRHCNLRREQDNEVASFGMKIAEYEATQWNVRFDQKPPEPDSLTTTTRVIVTFVDPDDDKHVIPYGSEAYKKEFTKATERIPQFKSLFTNSVGVPAGNALWTQGVDPEAKLSKCQKPRKMACKGG